MPPRESLALLPGTLDPLVLKSLTSGRKPGYGIAEYRCSPMVDDAGRLWRRLPDSI